MKYDNFIETRSVNTQYAYYKTVLKKIGIWHHIFEIISKYHKNPHVAIKLAILNRQRSFLMHFYGELTADTPTEAFIADCASLAFTKYDDALSRVARNKERFDQIFNSSNLNPQIP